MRLERVAIHNININSLAVSSLTKVHDPTTNLRKILLLYPDIYSNNVLQFEENTNHTNLKHRKKKHTLKTNSQRVKQAYLPKQGHRFNVYNFGEVPLVKLLFFLIIA